MHGKNTCGSTLLLNSSNLASFRTALVLERNLLLLESGDWRVPVSSAVPRLLLFEEGQPTRALFPSPPRNKHGNLTLFCPSLYLNLRSVDRPFVANPCPSRVIDSGGLVISGFLN